MQPPKAVVVMRPEIGRLRLARTASMALVCTLLAAGAHVVAGGRASSVSLVTVFLGTWLIVQPRSPGGGSRRPSSWACCCSDKR